MGLGKSVGLIISIAGDISGLDKSLGDAGKSIKGLGGISLKTAASVAGIAGAAGIAVGAIAEMTLAADADRTEQKKLAAAMDAVGELTDENTASVNDAIKAGQAKAFSDTEQRDALQSLFTATMNTQASTELLAHAQDIARFAGVDLATAADALAKAHAGQDMALTRLIPGLVKGESSAETMSNAFAMAAGQADIFAESAEGMQARAGDSFGELTETIGSIFLPILDEIIPALIPILQAFGELVESLLPLLIPLVKLVAEAFKVVAGALTVVVGWVKQLVDWLGKLLAPLNTVLDGLGNLPFGIMGKLGNAAEATPQSAGVSTFAAGGNTATHSGGFTINIYGDPSVIEATVTKALRDYSRRNGVGSVFAPGRS